MYLAPAGTPMRPSNPPAAAAVVGLGGLARAPCRSRTLAGTVVTLDLLVPSFTVTTFTNTQRCLDRSCPLIYAATPPTIALSAAPRPHLRKPQEQVNDAEAWYLNKHNPDNE